MAALIRWRLAAARVLTPRGAERRRGGGVGPVAWRLALGLVLMQIALATAVGLFTQQRDVGGSGSDATPALRAQGVAILRSIARDIERGDREGARDTAERWLIDDARVVHIAIRIESTAVVDVRRPSLADSDSSAVTVAVGFRRHGAEWAAGTVDFARPSEHWWTTRPWALQAAIAGSIGLLIAFAYLRRALVDLDPNAVVPERVRNAFDLLGQGVVLFDARGRIVLANEAFQGWMGGAQASLVGLSIDTIGWLGMHAAAKPLWREALEPGSTVRDRAVDAQGADGATIRLLVRGGPIADAQGQVRGGVLSFNDVTALDRLNHELHETVAQLARSHEQVESQNRQLAGLANLDGMTGAINRRGFETEVADTLAALLKQGGTASLVMIDIDHFKSVNDRYGHLAGDDVIKRLASTVRGELADDELLIRYGGEEFCVLLPRRAAPDAMQVAERLRAAVEARCRIGISADSASDHSADAELKVTASFGVATVRHWFDTLPSLVERADAALYAAKRAGRNRVMQEGGNE